jgi:hypothetical protein
MDHKRPVQDAVGNVGKLCHRSDLFAERFKPGKTFPKRCNFFPFENEKAFGPRQAGRVIGFCFVRYQTASVSDEI